MMMKRISLFLLLLIGVAMMSKAINVQRVLQDEVFNNKMSTELSMYIIEGDCSLSGDVELAAGSILKFEGGTIDAMPDTSFTIRGSNLIIGAPKYQIFGDSINVTGIANSEVSAHWWGAVGDGESCSLILYKKGSDKIAEEIPFTEEMMYGNVYAMVVYNLDIKAYDYNFRIAGRVVIDPYARKLSGTSVWGETDNVSVKSVVTDEVFDWEGDRPLGLLFEDSIIYRLHVRGFTKHSSSKVSKKGTFKGIEEKLPYLKELGINMINLMPAYEFYEVQSNNYTHISAEKNMINYWGYTEGNYFAPKASFAATGKDGGQIEEFKQLVKACHMNGLEVCMEFFFPEGVNQNLILECFRFWVREYHIDGIQSNIGNDVSNNSFYFIGFVGQCSF